MKFNIYRGSEKDMNERGGELNLVNLSKTEIARFCNRMKFNFSKFFNDGEYVVADNGVGFWVEEA